MAHFEVDKQTINDLQLFDDTGNSQSVFSFFDKVSTIGSRQKLTQMMRTPSNNIDILSSRRDSICYFYDHALSFPLDKNELDFIEHYLASNIQLSSGNSIDAFVSGIGYRFSNNGNYYTLSQGIRDVISLIRSLWAFYNRITVADCPPYLQSIFVRLGSFFSKKEILKIVSATTEQEPGYIKTGYYDSLFREKERATLRDVINIVYELDVYMAVAKTAAERGFCFPQYCADEQVYVKLVNLYHPGIQNAVKNDVLINEQKNLVFLTGANMAGKSSFLKALGLAVYLAHVGFPVPADSMQTSVFNGLITTINLSDNIANGYSHYYSEVKRVKETALKIAERSNMFIIFDELFRGTNVKDAYDASLATVKALSKINSSVFLISTHIVEIAEELKAYNNISFGYFIAKLQDGKPIFEYKIREGVSAETLGYFIFKNEGILEILEKLAKK
ncbi:MutS-related protein [Mucilaginibacter sp. FT3.2]|uniref:MutS-related protein n=1 Tax=Mucilaginibacter sp. FT3.2 TaxID=2723090 RepID=UPI0016185D5F|nr:hypothetical protein [Mucilaginibacter sp. FT3.2]MBB6231221.1 DNA mismatch repair ATPase MutS [Mucilaginibacter sp. FT3.2]